VWQPPWCNQWFGAMRDALAVGRDLPHPPLDAPGPFGLADADRTRRVLGAAGFAGIDFLGVEEPFRIGADADAAYRFTSGLSGMRALLADLHESQLQLALDNLRTMLEDHETVDGVMFDSAAWVVTATKP
ncbi:MAG: SAM-dependent methyltransferase, partial [Acidimicrobiia bacterium]